MINAQSEWAARFSFSGATQTRSPDMTLKGDSIPFAPLSSALQPEEHV